MANISITVHLEDFTKPDKVKKLKPFKIILPNYKKLVEELNELIKNASNDTSTVFSPKFQHSVEEIISLEECISLIPSINEKLSKTYTSLNKLIFQELGKNPEKIYRITYLDKEHILVTQRNVSIQVKNLFNDITTYIILQTKLEIDKNSSPINIFYLLEDFLNVYQIVYQKNGQIINPPLQNIW